MSFTPDAGRTTPGAAGTRDRARIAARLAGYALMSALVCALVAWVAGGWAGTLGTFPNSARPANAL